MALHRDIYWVGRQWAVTGFGIQAIDQRLKGSLTSRSPGCGTTIAVAAHARACLAQCRGFRQGAGPGAWALSEPARKKLPLVESVLELIQPVGGEPPKPATSIVEAMPIMETRRCGAVPAGIELPPAKAQPLNLRIERASAKFLPSWRVRR